MLLIDKLDMTGTDIYNAIHSISGVQNLVNDKISPIQRDQASDVPAIVYQTVSTNFNYNDSGRSLSDKNLDIYLYAETVTELEVLQLEFEKIENYTSETIDYIQLFDCGDAQPIESQQIYSIRYEIQIFYK